METSTTYNLSGYTLVKPDYIENEKLDTPIQMFDIEIAENNTFFIKHGEGNLLLHNCDGFHINGLLLAFFQRYTPSLIKNGRIKRLKTPIVVLKKSDKIVQFFFDLSDYKRFEKEKGLKGFNVEYKKGLGSWKKTDLESLIKQYGFEHFVETLKHDEMTDELIHNWMSGKTSDTRKAYIESQPFNSELI